MQIILDFEDWLKENDRTPGATAEIRKFSDWLRKDIICDFRKKTIQNYLEHLLVREDKQAVIRALKAFRIFLEFLRSICILEKMEFKPEWLKEAIEAEFNLKTVK